MERKFLTRACFALAVLGSLQAPALAKDANQNVVAPLPLLLVPMADNPKVGEELTLTSHTVFARFQVQRPPVATISQSREFTLAGQHYTIAPDSRLTAAANDSRMDGMLAKGSAIFCTESDRNTMSWLLPMVARYGAETRLCLVDQDNDKAFDALFLAGAKKLEDRAVQKLDPLPYASTDPKPAADERFEIGFERYMPLSARDPSFELIWTKDGKKVSNTSFLLGTGLIYELYSQNYGDVWQHMQLPKGPPPYDYRIGSVVFTVTDLGKGLPVKLKLKYPVRPMRFVPAGLSTNWVPPYTYPPFKASPAQPPLDLPAPAGAAAKN